MSQPKPVPSNRPRTADRVIEDVADRMRRGVREYGTALQAHNGRRALLDLYEELLDGAHYVRQRLDEEDYALREVVGDPQIRATLDVIYDRAEVVEKNPRRVNREALETRYIKDLGTMRMVVEALLTELMCARRTPPEPPPTYEIVGYQYRVVGPDGKPGYDECYDRQHIEDWCADQSVMVEGYYPEYRVLLAAPGWYRVDPEGPPLEPPGAHVVPAATGPAGDDGEPS